MKFSITEINESEKEVSIELSYDEIREEINAEVKKQAKNIELHGFRKGKVPEKILKSRFGNALEYEASEKVANTKFWDFADQNDIRPVGKPILTDIKFNPEKDLSFKVKFEVIPTFEPQAYTGLEIHIPDYIVTEHDVNHEIEHILKSNHTTQETEIVGDDEFYIVKVELQRTNKDGEAFADLKPQVVDIDLSNHSINQQIRENVKGKKVGESFTFTFEDNTQSSSVNNAEENKTETFYYLATVKEIKKIILPELNEDLVKKLTKDRISSPEQFKDEIKKDLEYYFAQRTEEYIRKKLMSLVVSNNNFEPPRSIVENVLTELVKQEEEERKKYRMPVMDKNTLRNQLLPSAEFEVKWYILKNMIQKKENITFSDDEMNDLANKEAEKTGISVEKLINYYRSSKIQEKMIDQKLFDFLKQKNTFIKVSPENLK